MPTVEELQAQLEVATATAHKLEAEAVHKGKELEKFKGIDPVEYGALKDEVSILRREQAKGDPGKLDELLAKEKQELEKRFGTKFTEYEGENKQLKSELQKLKVVNPALVKAAGIFRDTELDLIQMKIEQELTLDGNEIVAKGADGKPLPSKLDPRKNMGLEEYLNNLAEKYPGAAKPKGVATGKESGATNGASGAGFSGTLPTKEEALNLSPADLAKFNNDQLKQIFG